MKTTEYQGFCIAIVGTNGSGKTYYCDKIISNYKRPKLAVLDDDSEEYFDNWQEIDTDEVELIRNGRFKLLTGFKRKDKEEVCNTIYSSFNQNPKKGGLIFIDDAMTVLDSRPEFAFPLFKKRRQKKFDILLNCHGISEFPISLMKNITSIVVCKTIDTIEGNSKRISKTLVRNLEACIEIVNIVSKYLPWFKLEFNVKNPKNFIEILLDEKKMFQLINYAKNEFKRYEKNIR